MSIGEEDGMIDSGKHARDGLDEKRCKAMSKSGELSRVDMLTISQGPSS
jgi:hypothetical protein